MGTSVLSGIEIQNDLDLTVLSREVYTIFDMLSDIGGITSAIMTILVFLLNILNYMHFESYMASRVFFIQEEESNSSAFEASSCGNIAEYIIDTIPKRVQCCKKSRR